MLPPIFRNVLEGQGVVNLALTLHMQTSLTNTDIL